MILLDDNYYLSSDGIALLVIAGITVIFYCWYLITQVQKKNLEIGKIKSDLQLNINVLATAQFEKFKANELAAYQKLAEESAIQTAGALLQRWKIEEEEKFRKDAVVRSMGVNLGKITEHLIPFSTNFKQFNPRDARFIGSPIDLIVFDGIVEKKDIVTVYFIEVKTGGSVLNENQKKIKLAVDAKRIVWHQITIPEFNWEVKDT